MEILQTTDYLIFLLFVVGMAWIIIRYSGSRKQSLNEYFLANRELGWLVIGFGLFATNISSEHFAGLTGFGSKEGMAVANIEWMAILFLILLGWIFAPIFLKERITTIPELLEKRYNRSIRQFVSGLSILIYTLTKVSISLYAGGIIFEKLFGINIYLSALILLMITGLYTIVGGMRIVSYTTFFQAFFLILSTIVITGFSFMAIGGFHNVLHQVPDDFFHVFRSSSDPFLPWTGIVFGAPVLAFWYWCTDQYMVQKVLAAKNEKEARNGAILAGFLKIIPPLFLVFPGIMLGILFPGERGDSILGSFLVSSILPAGFKGIVLIGIISAIMSSLSSSFISSSTLFVMDFYKHWKPNSREEEYVLIGKITTIFMVMLGILWIPLLRVMDNMLFITLQQIQAYLSPPVVAVFLIGMISSKVNSRGAFYALVIGESIGILRLLYDYFYHASGMGIPILQTLFGLNFLHFAAVLLLISAGVLFVFSLASYPVEMFENNRMVFSRYLSRVYSVHGHRFQAFAIIHSGKYSFWLSVLLIGTLLVFWGFFL